MEGEFDADIDTPRTVQEMAAAWQAAMQPIPFEEVLLPDFEPDDYPLREDV